VASSTAGKDNKNGNNYFKPIIVFFSVFNQFVLFIESLCRCMKTQQKITAKLANSHIRISQTPQVETRYFISHSCVSMRMISEGNRAVITDEVKSKNHT